MEFRVLGPLEVDGAGDAKWAGSPRERVVLSVLLLQAGAVVSVDRLSEALWGDTPPRTAAKTIQNYVLRLRKRLGASLIDTQPPGYRIVDVEQSIDARRFEELVLSSRRSSNDGDVAAAACSLREALSLWRGVPFADLAGWSLAEHESTRLAELRLTAMEELATLELDLGHHAEAIVELAAMVDAEPLREHRWHLLMLALYRAGRQADALRTYQRARQALADDLGIEPGVELRSLERAILEQDPSLDLPLSTEQPSSRNGSSASREGVVFLLAVEADAAAERLDRLGDDAAETIRRDDLELFRATIAGTDGHEVGPGSGGMLAAFSSAVQALRCALAMRSAVAERNQTNTEPIAIRIGIHVGEPIHDAGEYVGTPVVVVQRLCETAAPGQILASELVAELVDSRGLFVFDTVGALGIKGFREPVLTVELLDETPSGTRARTPARPPYKGLASYEPSDSEIFFGRGVVVAGLLERLQGTRLLAVVGPSGSGKSSVIRAGLLAAIERGDLPGANASTTVLMTPGARPLSALAAAFATTDASALLRSLERDPRALDLAARALVATTPELGRVVVVIDQFEELFTLCDDTVERQRFVDALVTAACTVSGPVTLVLALRADFFGHCGAYPDLGQLLERGTALLCHMEADDLRAAIEGPALAAGLRLEPGLPELMTSDVVDEPGALPLLSHALLETWKRRRRRTLTVDGYVAAGGARGAIAQTAETVYGALATDQQLLVRSIFLRLTELGEGTEDTRRRATLGELRSASTGAEDLDAALGVLADARLVTVEQDTAQVADEALIREWPRLRTWLDEDRDGLRVHRHLTHAADDWASLDRDPAELYRGPRLSTAVEWTDRGGASLLNGRETEFLSASKRLRDDEEHQEARRVRRLRRLLAGVALALVITLVAGILAFAERNRADNAATRADAATISAEIDRMVSDVPTVATRDRRLAALLAVEASRRDPGADTRGVLLTAFANEPRLRVTLDGGRPGYSRLAVFPDGHRIAVIGSSGADVWNLSTRRRVGTFVERGATAIAVNADGSLIASGSGLGTITIRDADTMKRRGPTIQVGARVSDLSFSPDGTTLAVSVGIVGDSQATVPVRSQLWDLRSRRPTGVTLDGHTGVVSQVEYSPDGKVLVTGGNDGAVLLRDPTTGTPIAAPLHVEGAVNDLVFSPDGTQLGVGTLGSSGTLGSNGYLFDLATGTQMLSRLGGTGGSTYVGFSAGGTQFVVGANRLTITNIADGTTAAPEIDTQHGPAVVADLPGIGLVLTGFDGTLTVWDPGAGSAIARILPGSQHAAAYSSPNGSLIATSGTVDTVNVYRRVDRAPAATLSIGPPGARDYFEAATPVAFSADNRLLAIGNREGDVQWFDTRTLQPLTTPVKVSDKGGALALTFSPDGRSLVAVVAEDGVNGVHVVDVATRGVRSLDPPMAFAISASFRPDGRELAVSSAIGGGAIYPIVDGRIGTGSMLRSFGPKLESVAYSPDGKLLAVGSQDGAIRFLDATTHRPLGGRVASSGSLVAAIEFSGDSRYLTALTLDGRNQLFDVRDRTAIGPPFSSTGVGTFSSDSTLVLPGSSGSARWDLRAATLRRAACEVAGRNLTRAEWHRYLRAAGNYRKTCRA